MARPTSLPTYATGTGSTVVGSLNVDSINWQISLSGGSIVRYYFSDSPGLVSVVAGHELQVSGCTNSIHDGTLRVVGADNADKWVDAYNPDVTSSGTDETSSPGSGAVLASAARVKEPSASKKALGDRSPEKPSDGHSNWFKNLVGQWVEWLDDAVPAGFNRIQPKLTAGSNITITDNLDGTELISASLTITTIDAVGNTYSQASHGFAAKDVVRHNGTSWVKAQANTIPGATDCYLVTAAPTTGTFTAIKTGRVTITGHGLSAGTLYYLSAGTAGLLTTTKPVGDTSAPLGFFLPVLFVESANVVHVLGNAYPTFNPVLARYVNASSNADTVTFSNLDLVSYGGAIDFEIGVGSATNSGSGGEFQMRINGSSSSAYDYAANWDTGSAWTRQQAANQSNWVIARPSSFSGFDEPVFVRGTLGLSDVDGSASYAMVNTEFNHKTGMGISRGQYTSTVANITSVTFGIQGTITWRASQSHYVNLIWKGKAS